VTHNSFASPAAPSRKPASQKPTISYFIATGLGLGYLKPGPGTWGSLLGVGISVLLNLVESRWFAEPREAEALTWTVVVVISLAGVFTATRVARHSGGKDPQFVVIDEISGQLLALSIPFAALNWKSWLLGFILFRVFDIWKPFPAGRAESLPAGWGIMADDWIAGIYAALGLWLARAVHVLN
jgi:phosphatidylglycerophosphatase A